MDKSSISKLANSTFTSQFFQGDNKATQQCILPIQNSIYACIQIESIFYTQ